MRENGLGEQMRLAMRRAGLTGAEVARRMTEAKAQAGLQGKGVHQQMISSWLNGTKKPNAENLRVFAQVVGRTTDELLGVRESPVLAAGVRVMDEMIADVQAGGSPGEDTFLRAGADPSRLTAAGAPSADALLQVAHEFLQLGWATMTREEKLDVLAQLARHRAGDRTPDKSG